VAEGAIWKDLHRLFTTFFRQLKLADAYLGKPVGEGSGMPDRLPVAKTPAEFEVEVRDHADRRSMIVGTSLTIHSERKDFSSDMFAQWDEIVAANKTAREDHKRAVLQRKTDNEAVIGYLQEAVEKHHELQVKFENEQDVTVKNLKALLQQKFSDVNEKTKLAVLQRMCSFMLTSSTTSSEHNAEYIIQRTVQSQTTRARLTWEFALKLIMCAKS
jgi:hypothetical protein